MKLEKPSRRAQSIRSYEGKKERARFLGLFDRDYWRGRKDGRKAPSAWRSALGTIDADELRHGNEVRNTIRQGMGEAKTSLSHTHSLLGANKEKMDALRDAGGLLAAGAAESEHKGAVRESLFASLLILCEMAGLTFIAKDTFGQGLVPALVIAVLLSALIAFGIKLILGKVSPARKNQIKWGALALGLLLSAVGLIGFVVLRAETFNSGLMGSQMDLAQVGRGNLLLMTGLTLGVPLICGVLYENAQERMDMARNSLQLYRERDKLGDVANEWSIILSKLDEYDDRLDAVTEQCIAFRRNKYIRGFHTGGVRNPEAAEQIRQIGTQMA